MRKESIVIIGAGPAGLAAGIGFARRGYNTVVFEKKKLPINKACGEGIMPPGVEILRELGVLDVALKMGANYFDGICYIDDGGRRLEGEFAEGLGLAMKRIVLSQILYDVAKQTNGLTIKEGISVGNLDKIQADLLIGADGIRSGVRNHFHLGSNVTAIKRYGVTQHYAVKPWNSKVEVHVQDGFEAYVTPCAKNEVGVAFLWDTRRYKPNSTGKELVSAFLSEFRELKNRLMTAMTVGPAQAIGHFYRPVDWPVTPRVALIGDAAGYVDPMTGEGISLALKSAKLLVQCVSQNKPLSWYASELQKQRRAHVMTTHAMLFLARHPKWRAIALDWFSKHPRIFQKLLSFNMA